MAEKTALTTSAQRERRTVPSLWNANPFGALQRLTDEMDRILDDLGLPHRFTTRPWRTAASELWAPDIDVYQRNNELVVKADLPGMKKDDIKIDLTENSLTIQGERRAEHEEERQGVYRCERSYGSFHRLVPLPEGAITEQAKATFRDGVLEVTMPAPPEQVSRGRRLEITEGSPK
jgi:HSP20 family protein